MHQCPLHDESGHASASGPFPQGPWQGCPCPGPRRALASEVRTRPGRAARSGRVWGGVPEKPVGRRPPAAGAGCGLRAPRCCLSAARQVLGPAQVGRGRAHAARGSAGKHVPLRPGAGAPFRTFPKLAATSPAGPWQPGDRAFPCGTVHMASLLSPGRVVSSVGKSDGGSGSSGAGVTFPSRPGLACAGVPFRSVPDRTCGRCECVVFSWGW